MNNEDEFVDAKQELEDVQEENDSNFDDTASFVSAVGDVSNTTQEMSIKVDTSMEEIPQDVTKEELYLLRSALEKTYSIKKKEAVEKARHALKEKFEERLMSDEVDKLLDEYIKLKQDKEQAQLREDVQAQVDIKSKIGNLEGKILLDNQDMYDMCKQNIKEYNDKYNRIWDMWLERYDKVKYDPPKELTDLARINKFMEDNGLCLSQKEDKKSDKVDIEVEMYFTNRPLVQKKSFIRRVISALVYIPVTIKNEISRVVNKLFKIRDKEERLIDKEIKNIDNMISKEQRDDLLAKKNELIKLKYKYKIFKGQVSKNPYLRQGFENSIKLSLDTIKQATVAKKSLKLQQDQSDIAQTKDDLLKPQKLSPKLNNIEKRKKYKEEISKFK